MPRLRCLLPVALLVLVAPMGCGGDDPPLDFDASAAVPGFPVVLRGGVAGGLALTVDTSRVRRTFALPSGSAALSGRATSGAPTTPGPPEDTPDRRGAPTALRPFEHGVAAEGSGVLLRIVERGARSRLLAQAFAADGAQGLEQPLGPGAAKILEPRLAVGADGSALAIWKRRDGGAQRFWYAFRPPGRPFSAARALPEGRATSSRTLRPGAAPGSWPTRPRAARGSRAWCATDGPGSGSRSRPPRAASAWSPQSPATGRPSSAS